MFLQNIHSLSTIFVFLFYMTWVVFTVIHIKEMFKGIEKYQEGSITAEEMERLYPFTQLKKYRQVALCGLLITTLLTLSIPYRNPVSGFTTLNRQENVTLEKIDYPQYKRLAPLQGLPPVYKERLEIEKGI